MSALFDLGPHGGFIWASYLAVAVAVAGLFLWITLDRRKQRRLLADLERRGVRRRSARQGDAGEVGAARKETQS